MPIEFHCEHCGKLVKAPSEGAGRSGRCPHCGGVTYVPSAIDEGELDLAPLDDKDEERRKRAALEAAALQRSLLHERAVPGEPGGKGGARGATGATAAPGGVVTTKQLASLIVGYVDAMSQGKLPRAEEVARELGRHKSQVLSLLEEMAGEDLAAYGLPSLPKPVLLGFLKQLRAKL